MADAFAVVVKSDGSVDQSAAWLWIAALSRGEPVVLAVQKRDPATLEGILASMRFVMRTLELVAAKKKAFATEREIALAVADGFKTALAHGSIRACSQEGCGVLFDASEDKSLEWTFEGVGICPVCKGRYEITTSFERAKAIWEDQPAPQQKPVGGWF